MALGFGLFGLSAFVSVSANVPVPAAPEPSHVIVRATLLSVNPVGAEPPVQVIVEPVVVPRMLAVIPVPTGNVALSRDRVPSVGCSKTLVTLIVKVNGLG